MILRKLFTAVKGKFNDAAEEVADANAITILEQEMREAKQEMLQAEQSLTGIVAKRKMADQKVASVKADVERYTDAAIKASESGDEGLAVECAERVAELESTLAGEKSIVDGFTKSEQALKSGIAKAKDNMRRVEQQIDHVKATDSVQKTQVAVSSRHLGANSKVKTALDSLERVKDKQAMRSAEIDAANELASEESGSSLEKKLKDAGISAGGEVSGNDKLAQILASKKG